MEVPAAKHHVSQHLGNEGDDETLHQRQSVDFHSTVWGDYFIDNPPYIEPRSGSGIKQKIRGLVEEVRVSLANTADPLDKLHLIDALQLLGISYHLKTEIDEALDKLHKAPIESDDLYVVALQFRLLRQNRRKASSDVFNKFKDGKGNFKASSLSSDARGLLSLHEAAYFGVPGEDILDEVIGFTRPLLRSMVHNLDPTLKAMVFRSLETPIARKVGRLEAREYIAIYQHKEEAQYNVVLKLAKLDFHLLQLMYREEIRDICMWWKKLGLVDKLGYSRDRIVECYFLSVGMYYEPLFARERKIVAKVFGLLTLCDDTFDTYGKPYELDKFNEAIQRWDLEAVRQLPDYMKHLFLAILEFCKEVEDELTVQGKGYRMRYVKDEMKRQIHSYWKESKWCSQGYVPTFDEHLRVSMISIAFAVTVCTSYAVTGEEATEDFFEWFTSLPKILHAVCTMGRLYNDIVSHELEQERIHVASTVECYMKDHGATKQEACNTIKGMIESAWKTLNHEYLQLTEIPTTLVMPMMNLACLCFDAYKYMDAYTNSTMLMKDKIESMLVKLIHV